MGQYFQLDEEIVEDTRQQLTKTKQELNSIEAAIRQIGNAVVGVQYFDAGGTYQSKFSSVADSVMNSGDDVAEGIKTLDILETNAQNYIKSDTSWANAGMLGTGFLHGLFDVGEGIWDGIRATGARLFYGDNPSKLKEIMDDIAIDKSSELFSGWYAYLQAKGATLTPDSKEVTWAKGFGSMAAYIGIATISGGGAAGLVVQATTSGLAGMGRGTETALMNGASYEEALAAGTKEGLKEAALEVVMGKGIDALGRARKVGLAGRDAIRKTAEEGVQKVSEEAGERFAKKLVEDAGNNLLEKSSQEALEAAAKRTGTENVKELIGKAAQGTLTTAEKETLETIAKNAGEEVTNKMIKEAGEEAVKGVKKFGKEAQTAGKEYINEAGEKALRESAAAAEQKALEKAGKELTPYEMTNAMKEAGDKAIAGATEKQIQRAGIKAYDAAKVAEKAAARQAGRQVGKEAAEDVTQRVVTNADDLAKAEKAIDAKRIAGELTSDQAIAAKRQINMVDIANAKKELDALGTTATEEARNLAKAKFDRAVSNYRLNTGDFSGKTLDDTLSLLDKSMNPSAKEVAQQTINSTGKAVSNAVYDLRHGTTSLDNGLASFGKKVNNALHGNKLTGAIIDVTGKAASNNVIRKGAYVAAAGLLLKDNVDLAEGKISIPGKGMVGPNSSTSGAADSSITDPGASTGDPGTTDGNNNVDYGNGSSSDGSSGGVGGVDSGDTPPTTTTPSTETPTTPEKETDPPADTDSGTVIGGEGLGGNDFSGEGMSFDSDTDDIESLEDPDIGEDLDDQIVTIPTTIKGVSTKSSNKSTAAVPVLGALGVAAAAGIGAKVYMDNKANNTNDEEDEEYDDFENSEINADEWNGDEMGDTTDNDESYLMYDKNSLDDLELGTGEIQDFERRKVK